MPSHRVFHRVNASIGVGLCGPWKIYPPRRSCNSSVLAVIAAAEVGPLFVSGHRARPCRVAAGSPPAPCAPTTLTCQRRPTRPSASSTPALPCALPPARHAPALHTRALSLFLYHGYAATPCLYASHMTIAHDYRTPRTPLYLYYPLEPHSLTRRPTDYTVHACGTAPSSR